MQKRTSGNYFNFTRKERNGTIFLLLVILLLATVPFIYPLIFKEKIIDPGNIQHELTALKTIQKENTKKYFPGNYDKDNSQYNDHSSEKKFHPYQAKGELFNFDPNILSADGWKKLGLRDNTISTIQNFILKGGKFHRPEDIKKIWGLHEDEVARLLPYIRITENIPATETLKPGNTSTRYEFKKTIEPLDINLADTNAWISLPGIGTKLSNRIINFRERLGGFYSITQVAETFGLPDSVFQKIRPALVLNDKNIKQLNINTATADELKQHPYIRYNLANSIVQYRTQHGNFLAISDIKRIMLINDEIYNKLSPYLTLQ